MKLIEVFFEQKKDCKRDMIQARNRRYMLKFSALNGGGRWRIRTVDPLLVRQGNTRLKWLIHNLFFAHHFRLQSICSFLYFIAMHITTR